MTRSRKPHTNSISVESIRLRMNEKPFEDVNMWISTLIRERTENLLMRFSSFFSSSSFSLFLVFFSITKVTRKTKKRHEKTKKRKKRKKENEKRKTKKKKNEKERKNWLSDGAPLPSAASLS